MIVATNYMRFAAPVKVHKFEDYISRSLQTIPIASQTVTLGVV